MLTPRVETSEGKPERRSFYGQGWLEYRDPSGETHEVRVYASEELVILHEGKSVTGMSSPKVDVLVNSFYTDEGCLDFAPGSELTFLSFQALDYDEGRGRGSHEGVGTRGLW
jgi:hypothetical protein